MGTHALVACSLLLSIALSETTEQVIRLKIHPEAPVDSIQYTTSLLTPEELSDVTPFYDDLPLDPYLETVSRTRRFGKYMLDSIGGATKPIQLSYKGNVFVQTGMYNDLVRSARTARTAHTAAPAAAARACPVEAVATGPRPTPAPASHARACLAPRPSPPAPPRALLHGAQERQDGDGPAVRGAQARILRVTDGAEAARALPRVDEVDGRAARRGLRAGHPRRAPHRPGRGDPRGYTQRWVPLRALGAARGAAARAAAPSGARCVRCARRAHPSTRAPRASLARAPRASRRR